MSPLVQNIKRIAFVASQTPEAREACAATG